MNAADALRAGIICEGEADDAREAARGLEAAAPRRMRRKAADVRRALLVSARKVFEESGYSGATTREIAREAGVNEVLLFRHFGNKANLFGETVFEPFAQLLHDFHTTGRTLANDLEDRKIFIGRLVVLANKIGGC